MIIINSYFFIGTVTLVICASCVYSLSFPRNNIIIKNANKKLNCTDNICNTILLNPSQKIIFINSNREINIYRNYLDNNVFILKLDNSIKFIKVNKLDDNKIDYKLDDTNDYQTYNRIQSDLLDKKIIKISPGGLYGFYDAGICSIIKKNYNLDKYIFSGASAGAWNSLFMSYKNDINDLIQSVFEIDVNFSSIKQLQINLKEKILKSHKTEEFDLKKVFISVCVFDNFQFKNYIYTDFVDLSDALDCCIASSNIPFITGNLIHKYRNKITFDGGFLHNQTFLFAKPNFEINHAIWERKRFFTSLFDKANINIHKLYSEGIDDTSSNINVLDKEFFDDFV